VAKKEMRRAARQSQKPRQSGPRRPTWRRAAVQGLLLTALFVLLNRFVLRSAWPSGPQAIAVYIGMLAFFFLLYSVFIYYWEGFLFRRRQRKQ
jgi:hypothetical protein